MYEEFYSREDTEKALGGSEEYRAVVYDDSENYEVSIYDIGKYGGKWFVLRAQGCSCWGGEYWKEAGPFSSLQEVRKYVYDEYGKVKTDYYSPLLRAWEVAFTNAWHHEESLID